MVTISYTEREQKENSNAFNTQMLVQNLAEVLNSEQGRLKVLRY